MALKVNDSDALPHYFCYECSIMLHKFHKFKEKCYRGQKALKELLWAGPITYESVYKIDRESKHLQSDLTVRFVTNQIETYTTKDIRKDQEDDINKISEDISEQESDESCNNDDNTENDAINKQPNSPATVFINNKKECMKLQNEMIKERRKIRNADELRQKKKTFDTSKWEVFTLTEEEALKEFRLKAEDQKYLTASYKCQDCFKGFSKEDMLKRHIKLGHSEDLGDFECRFCRMRFKLRCHLHRHMERHYKKYKCLRCDLVCSLRYSAILHDDYHSGIAKTCMHCGEQFRHSSTYYTHLRTHRSDYVCTLCGVSFVSESGLRQHKRVKHVTHEIESPDDYEDVNTYCDRCNIRFETRKAYEEHLFHSAMHSEGAEAESENQKSAPKKVLGRKIQAKITKNLRRRQSDEEPFKLETKRRRKIRREYCKPTTCYQCGKHFKTQKACMKHHRTEHPRTSFFPPTQRHICEICGASLAPGSVLTHQNMHTRTTIHACETCGKEFYSSISLKRHLVTHTGEKRFACPLCDKRFTQSNSMKLHYRTFHLKQPYPKRNRTKKMAETQDIVDIEETSDESDNSSPEPDLNNAQSTESILKQSESGPEIRSQQRPEVLLATENANELQAIQPIQDRHIAEENVHYLTLA
ncbi:unnamed protein product [Parnassius apollo]|uniref:(apollo) hypothetical protein n=1 Tax=Parnassius apollo TaxID=110799 RepID=A0A8S3Y8Y0_PARAO|nr:unnamed protein product [Parnassius apollo]